MCCPSPEASCSRQINAIIFTNKSNGELVKLPLGVQLCNEEELNKDTNLNVLDLPSVLKIVQIEMKIAQAVSGVYNFRFAAVRIFGSRLIPANWRRLRPGSRWARPSAEEERSPSARRSALWGQAGGGKAFIKTFRGLWLAPHCNWFLVEPSY